MHVRPNEQGGPYIYMGYAPENKEKAEEVITALQSYGYRIWFAAEELQDEASYDEIIRRIAGCKTYCCLITWDFYLSEYCREEFRFAKEMLKKPVAAIYLEQFRRPLPDGMKEWLKESDIFTGADIRPVPERIKASGLVDDCRYHPGIRSFQDAEKGDTVEFGRYEQGNGIAPIRWIVLDRTGTGLLLLSKYGLDCRCFQEEYEETSWAGCSMRRWLNTIFLQQAFRETERARILRSLVQAHPNPRYRTERKAPSVDKVFLLSILEARKYFDTDADRMCRPTPFAAENAGKNSMVRNYCWWWLRTSGFREERAAIVELTGNVLPRGARVNDTTVAVRPALWVSLQ